MKWKFILGIVCFLILLTSFIGAGENELYYLGEMDVYFDESAIVESTYEEGYEVLHLEFFDIDEESKRVSLYWGCLEDSPFYSGVGCVLYLDGLTKASIDEAGIVIVEIEEDLKILDYVYTAGSAMTIYLDDGLVLVNRNPDNLIYYCPQVDFYLPEIDYNYCQELIADKPLNILGDGTIEGDFAYYSDAGYITVSGQALLTSTGLRALPGTEITQKGFTINSVSDYVMIPYGNELLPMVENQVVIRSDGLSAQGNGFTFQTWNKEYIEEDPAYEAFLATAQEYVPLRDDSLKIEMNGGTVDIEILGFTKEYSERALRTDITGDVKFINGKLNIYSREGDVFYSKDFDDVTLDSVPSEIVIGDSEIDILDYISIEDAIEIKDGDSMQLVVNPEDPNFEYLFKDISYFDERDYFQTGDFPMKGSEEYYHIKSIQHAVGLTDDDVDGKYGETTRKSVKVWQEAYNQLYCNGNSCLQEDGLWGENSQQAYLEMINKETVVYPLQSHHLQEYDSVSALVDDYFDQVGITATPEQKELFLQQTEHLNNLGSVGERTRTLDSGDTLLLPVELAGYSTANLNFQSATQTTIKDEAWRTILPEPTEWNSFERDVFEEELAKAIQKRYSTDAKNLADATRRYGSPKQAGHLYSSTFVETLSKYETDSPVESLSMLSALAWQESGMGTGFAYTKEETGEQVLLFAEETGQEENVQIIAQALGQDNINLPATTGIFQMGVGLQQEKAVELRMPTDENLIRTGSYYPQFATPIATDHMMDIAELYALNSEGLVEINEDNARLIAASWNAGPYRPRNAAVQDALVELEYLSPTYVNSNGEKKDSRDGVFGDNSRDAMENFILNYVIETGEDYDSLLADLDKAGSGFRGTRLYDAIKEKYKEETGKDLAPGIVPVDVNAMGKGSQSLDRYVSKVLDSYLFFERELEQGLFEFEED